MLITRQVPFFFTRTWLRNIRVAWGGCPVRAGGEDDGHMELRDALAHWGHAKRCHFRIQFPRPFVELGEALHGRIAPPDNIAARDPEELRRIGEHRFERPGVVRVLDLDEFLESGAHVIDGRVGGARLDGEGGENHRDGNAKARHIRSSIGPGTRRC
jgi:hypothetical protein